MPEKKKKEAEEAEEKEEKKEELKPARPPLTREELEALRRKLGEKYH